MLDDASGTAIVTNNTIDSVALWMRSAVSNDLDMTTHSSDTYRRCRALRNGEGSEVLARILPPELTAVKELQFGVYHHRIVLVFSIESGDVSLGSIRTLRQHATDYARGIFDSVVERSSGEGAIRHIVAYPLVLVPKGNRLLRKEDKLLKSEGYSHLYSTTTTTFCLRVRASRIPGDLRRHCLRVSVPGIIVYQAGRSISKPLVNSIVDAVYYGALYARAEGSLIRGKKEEGVIAETERGGAATSEMTLGTNELLREVVAMLKERVAGELRYNFESALTVIGLVIAILIAIFSGLTLIRLS
jgi:hypothetical protein